MCDTCVETTEGAAQTEVHVHVLGIAVEEGSQTRGLLSQAGGRYDPKAQTVRPLTLNP